MWLIFGLLEAQTKVRINSNQNRMKRLSLFHLVFTCFLFLGFCLSISAQSVIENLKVVSQQFDARKAYDLAKLKRDYLQKTTYSDTLPLPFFDDFARTDLSWAPTNNRFGLAINRLEFFSNTNGRAFGNQGLMVKTIDRGSNWNTVGSLSDTNILAVSFIGNTGNGWACGSQGFLAQTSDTGNVWNPKNSPAGNTTLVDVSFRNASEGLIADSLGRLYITNNGGNSWTQVVSSGMEKFYVNCVAWSGTGQPVVAGDSSKTAISNDGGFSWVISGVATKTNQRFRRIKFFDNQIGFAVGDSGLLYKTFNSGQSWMKTFSNSNRSLSDLNFAYSINKKLGWAVGRGGTLLSTQDGGNSWTQIRSGTIEDLTAVTMITEYRGWIASAQGTLIQVVIDPSRPESKWWERNSGVYINNNFCHQPISFGVATFDGTDQEGLPYSNEPNQTGGCDTLTSIHLDLGGNVGAVNLSFYYQPGGLIVQQRPDYTDSLVVQFKTPHNKWVSAWRKTGDNSQFTAPFYYAAIPIADSLKYQGFQFRFINYGTRNGNFDIWSIDYVRLDNKHNLADSSALDLALTENPGKILKDFYAYPLDQFNELLSSGSLFSDEVTGEAINLNGAGDFNNISGKFRITSERKNTILVERPNTSIQGMGLIPTKNKRQLFSIPKSEYLPIGLTPEWTTLKYGYFLDSDPDYNTFSNNDTLYGRLNLSTYMAYDDGSAEATKKILGTAAKGAVRFFLPRTDTITDIAIYYPRSPVTETQDINFTLILYRDIDVENNQESPIFRLPVTLPPVGDSLNRLNFFSLRLRPQSQRILEGGKYFYIGWQNPVVDNGNEVSIGLDLNSSSPGNFFYTVSGAWLTETRDNFPLMIRPVFGEEVPTAVKGRLTEPKTSFYPNPAQKIISNPDGFSNLKIHTISGQECFSDLNLEGKSDLELNLIPGLYFITWNEKDGRPVSQKLIIE